MLSEQRRWDWSLTSNVRSVCDCEDQTRGSRVATRRFSRRATQSLASVAPDRVTIIHTILTGCGVAL